MSEPGSCLACGAALGVNAKFCASCGTPVAIAPTCPFCGARSPDGARFCPSCGAALQSAPPSTPKPAPPPQPDVCSNCGATLVLDAQFCGVCGSPVAATSAPVPATAAGPPACHACGAALRANARVTGVTRALEQLEAVVNAGDPPDVTLRCAVRDLVASAFGPIEQFAIVLADPPDLSPDNHERVRTLQRKYEALLGDILERGIRQGHFVEGNPKLMMFTLIRAALGTAIWYRPGGQWEPDWIIEQVTAQLMRSVLAR